VPSATVMSALCQNATLPICALRKIIDSPETQAQFKNIGFEGFSSTPEELGDFIKAQLAHWGKMIKDANIELD